MKLAASFLALEDKSLISVLAKESIDYLHLDIMDGVYVKNKTLPFSLLKQNLENVTKPFDIHLMVKDVLSYIKVYQTLHPEFITFHILDENTLEIIEYLKKNNIKVGLAINPKQPIDLLKPFLDKIDLVLVMSVEPGYGGQKFIPDVLDKVASLKKLKANNNYQFLIEIDGGINDCNINLCLDCDIVVVGSFITSGNFKTQISKLRNIIK